MRYTKSSWLIILIALSLILSACNLGQEPEPTPDVGAIFTAAVETISAQFAVNLTQTALAAPTATPIPTNTPVPTFAVESPVAGAPTTPVIIGTQPALATPLATITPLGSLATQAGPACMNAAFIQDVTHPDGTAVKAGEWIRKKWQIQNTGTCTWDDGFSLQPVTGDATGSWVIDEKVIKKVAPNEIVEIALDLKIPANKTGEWGGCWRMQGDSGYYFGTFVCLLVTIQK